jgi:hypothetical protein
MTRLPAPSVKAEALQLAHAYIVEFRDGKNPWSDVSPLTSEAGGAMFRHMLRVTALNHPVGMLNVIDMARGGEPDADAVLRTLILEYKSRQEAMPTELAGYDMELTARDGGFLRPPARQKKSNVLRDICIAIAVAAVIDRFGLRPTGRSPLKLSACSVVAEALEVAHLRLGYKAVEEIWRRYKRSVPTVPGWSFSPAWAPRAAAGPS